MISYAQNFEDVILARVFHERTDGFYVDVGAGDPVDMSVTKWLYDLGWSGINIEPSPILHPRLAAQRTRDVNLDCAVGEVAGETTYFQMPQAELSSCDPRARARAEAAGEVVVARTIPVRTLTEILDRHADQRTIDFLKIDVEGWERQVLSGLDLGRHRPTVIVVEATVPTMRVESHREWEDILLCSSYHSIYFDGLSRFYLPAERPDLRVHFQLPPNVFDDFKSRHLVEAEGKLTEAYAEIERLRAFTNGARDITAELRRIFAAVDPKHLDRELPGPETTSRSAQAIFDHELDPLRRAARTLSSGRLLARHAAATLLHRLHARLPGGRA